MIYELNEKASLALFVRYSYNVLGTTKILPTTFKDFLTKFVAQSKLEGVKIKKTYTNSRLRINFYFEKIKSENKDIYMADWKFFSEALDILNKLPEEVSLVLDNVIKTELSLKSKEQIDILKSKAAAEIALCKAEYYKNYKEVDEGCAEFLNQ